MKVRVLVAVLSLTCRWALAGEGDAHLRLEFGPVWQSVNTVQIPSPGGTRFSLVDFGLGPKSAFRLDASLKVGERSELRALFAPLSLTFPGILPAPVDFQGTTFAAGVDTTALYVFNSYRLTYRYRLQGTENWSFWIGFTGKIRDAEVRLTQGGLTAGRSNVGFVPLLHLKARHLISAAVALNIEVDALAAPQGRAEDIALLGSLAVSPGAEILAGYRTVEGGAAGGGGVYTFAWLHYVVLGFGLRI